MKYFIALSICFGLAAFAESKAPLATESQGLNMSAHEIKGVDRKAMTIALDEDENADLALSGIDAQRSGWKEKMERAAEEMSWW